MYSRHAQGPLLLLWKTFAGSCCALQLRSCSVFLFAAKLSEWKMEPLIVPFPQPPPPRTPASSLCSPEAFKRSPMNHSFPMPVTFSPSSSSLTFPQTLDGAYHCLVLSQFCDSVLCGSHVPLGVSTRPLQNMASEEQNRLCPLLSLCCALLVMSPGFCYVSCHLCKEDTRGVWKTMGFKPWPILSTPAGSSQVSHWHFWASFTW